MKQASVIFGIIGAVSACAEPSTEPTLTASSTAGTCNPERPAESFERLIGAPIVPPQMFGGVDLAGGMWSGLSLDDMERSYCHADFITEDEELAHVGWGSSTDRVVSLEYKKASRRVESFTLHAGYKGSLDFASRPSALGTSTSPNPFGQHTYSIGLGRPVLRDGQPWGLNWKKKCTAPTDLDCWDRQATELFDAMMYTFAPELPSTQENCVREQLCLARTFPTMGGIFGVRLLGIYLHVPAPEAPPPAASTPDYFYGFPIKLAPFSHAEAFLKLDDEGPIAVARELGDRRSECVMKLGVSFGAFAESCVRVLADSKANDLVEAKLLGGVSRTVTATGGAGGLRGTWHLDVSGVHPSFVSERFDESKPPATARASALVLDQRTAGKVLNEYSEDKAKLTLAASGAIYREYARLVQKLLHEGMDPSLPRFPLGDSHCLLPAGGNAATWRPARGCTGMEQFISPAEPSTTSDPGLQRVSAGPGRATLLQITSALRPGLLTAAFCIDAGTFEQCDPQHEWSLFAGTRAHVIAVLGGGDASALPAAARDHKTYVRLWMRALVKYLRAANERPTDLSDPRYDSLTPLDHELTIESVRNDLVSVRYRDKVEYRVGYLSGAVEHLVFH